MHFIELKKSKLNHIYWNMKTRCKESYAVKKPWYKDTKICEEWQHNMYSFYEWVNEGQFYEIPGEKSVHLDKDILGRVKGLEKIYSPETCLFVPAKVNNFFGGSSSGNKELPVGVERSGDKYKVSTKAFNIHDVFDTPGEAWECWKEHKQAQKIVLADEYYSKKLIPRKVYDAMMQYEFRITD